jgi:hypothetical protein
VGDEGQGVVYICNLKVEDLVKCVFVLDVGGRSFCSPFITNCVCQAWGVYCHRLGSMSNEVLKLSNASGKQCGFGGTRSRVI